MWMDGVGPPTLARGVFTGEKPFVGGLTQRITGKTGLKGLSEELERPFLTWRRELNLLLPAPMRSTLSGEMGSSLSPSFFLETVQFIQTRLKKTTTY